MMKRQTLFAIAGMSFSVLPATAQNVVDAGKIVLDSWSDEALYASDALSVDELFGRDVTGEGGERTGDVEDLVLNDSGEIIALIAEVGGFWDIGDTHVSVPWDMVQISADRSVAVPMTQDQIPDFDLFASSGLPEDANVAGEIIEGVDDQALGSELWRASDLMGDYVRVVGDGERWVNFGYVSDLMINDGAITATLVRTTVRYGPGTYAYPYHGGPEEGFGMWAPGSSTLDLPILVGDAVSRPQFDAERMKSK
ncbi:PRC-barrel domain-containing protein [Ruegeria marina]|uniref:Sporulation protein YlmC, PRC-barrel domain family n=1 Tax=Ruegeria marina TaxID=639004 RepID=A0A1G6UZ51_9RHOB|nr:PRC-barrel domain-containing protein [Ruegeria marina]SDD46554.1 Sporulation protein YlmC, PRC-barrel domain family [Ruegeria marina]